MANRRFQTIIVTLLLCIGCSDNLAIDFTPLQYKLQGYNLELWDKQYPEAGYETLHDSCQNIFTGLTVAYVGGSLASLDESNVAKEISYTNLNFSRITTYGYGGLGYSTTPYSFRNFLPEMENQDIFILWCSTNDYVNGIPAGQPTDYTSEDNFDESHLHTQCGGMNYLIHEIRTRFPQAQIIGFTSLPFFGSNGNRPDGNLENAPRGANQDCNFQEYVEMQKKTFEHNNIQCLDQFHLGLFNETNFREFYKEDGFHLKENGYFLLGCAQLRFLLLALTQ